MKSDKEILAENISRLMGSRWNNTSLGKEAGLAANTIKNWRDPKRDGSAKVDDLALLAKALKVSVAYLVTEHTEDGQPLEQSPEDDETAHAMAVVHEAATMLADVLAGIDHEGRELVASALRGFAMDPQARMSRLIKAFEAALDAPAPEAPTPAGPPTGRKGEVARAVRSAGRANLVVKPGGGQDVQQRLALPSALRQIIDNTSPRSLREKLDNRNAPQRERDELYSSIRQYPKASE